MTTHNRPQFGSLTNNPMGIVGVFQERPNKYMMLLSFAQEILREESHLSPTEREIIAAYTSKLNGCEYCCGSHTAFAVSIGAESKDVEAIKSGNIENHPMESLLAYVKKLTLAPSSISNEDRLLVNEAGFSDEQLKDAIAVCAAFNLFNRIVEGHGVHPQENYDQDVAMINEQGYDRRYKSSFNS
jgi:uncharacterized peroxidase-related enzyme